jgi:hypothetical protein
MNSLRRLLYLLRFRHHADELTEELELHRSMKIEELESRGWSEAETRLEAARILGNLTQAREDVRRVWLWPWFESVLQDLGYAVRSLHNQPGFTVIAIATLTVAIGLNMRVA